jgi:hypothetical protein
LVCQENLRLEGDLEWLFTGRTSDLSRTGARFEAQTSLTGRTSEFYLDNLWIDGKLNKTGTTLNFRRPLIDSDYENF